jgi:hypothetical protein
MSTSTKKAKHAKADSKPRQDTNAINQLALKAQALALQHKDKIGPRLSTEFLASFTADLADLGDKVPAVIVAKDGKVQLTAAQNSAVLTGYNLVKGLRTTVKGYKPGKDVLLAYGVGSHVHTNVVKDVTAAIQKILDRVKAEPAEAAAFSIVEDDVKGLNAALKAIGDADDKQELARATAPQTTAQRNATARRLLDGIKKIAGAGMRAFVNDQTIYANFEALTTKAAG